MRADVRIHSAELVGEASFGNGDVLTQIVRESRASPIHVDHAAGKANAGVLQRSQIDGLMIRTSHQLQRGGSA
jgi:hypothetical protein